jgi:hypothetical protein
MKIKPFDSHRPITSRRDDARASFSVRASSVQVHRTSAAYARSRMTNAAIHDRAPRATTQMRIGIVSEPYFRDASRWPTIRAQMKRILAEHGGRGTEAVTLLAAASDRLFAMVAREQGMRLSVVVPCENFQNVFATPDELSEYVHLRMLAHSLTTLRRPRFDRAAFEEASKLIIDTCDLLVAIGGESSLNARTGSGSILQYAREHAQLLIWLDPEAPAVNPALTLIR